MKSLTGVQTDQQHVTRMRFGLISTLVLMFLMTGVAKSNPSRQKRFILLKRLLQMNGNGESTVFREWDPTAPSCPPIYIQQQSQPESTQAPYYSTTPAPYYTTTPAAAYYTSPAYNPPPTYDDSTPAPPPAYSKPSYSPSQPRYEQIPSYLQMPPIYKPPTPTYTTEQNYNHQPPPSSYQSALVPQHMFRN